MRRYLVSGLLIVSIAISATAKAESADQQMIRKELIQACTDFIAGDAKASIAFYLPSVMIFDVAPPRQKTFAMVQKFNQEIISMIVGKPVCVYERIDPVVLTPEYAYSTDILHTSGKLKNGGEFDLVERSTDIYRKVDGAWRVIHEHNSVPANVVTGKADLRSSP